MKKIFYFIILLILSVYILSEFIGDKFIKGVVEKNISSTLDRKIKIESLNISYLKGEAIVQNIDNQSQLIFNTNWFSPVEHEN